jgi:hypothetical protein
MFVRYTRDADQQYLALLVLAGQVETTRSPSICSTSKQAPAWNGTYNLTTTLSPTLTNEFVFGASQNNPDAQSDRSERWNLQRLRLQVGDALSPSRRLQFINIAFGNGHIAGHNWAGTASYSQFPYKNSNTTFDFYDNVSKVSGAHTIEGGIYVRRSRKDQAAGNSMSIVFNPLNNPGGTANLANTNNTGHAYADALLGAFSTLNQPTRGIYQGQYRSTNVEWCICRTTGRSTGG